MYEQFYLDPRVVPKIFKIADKEMERRNPPENRCTETREIPMPYIDSNPNVQGPMYITEDWYFKKKKNKMVEHARDVRDVHIEMMQLIARKDMLKIKLGELDPGKKQDSKRIVAINIELKDIDAELSMLSWQYGINVEELDKGSRLSRFIGRMKRRVKKIGKKIKRFWEDHSDFIINMGAIILPVVTAFVCKLIFKL